MSDVTKICGRMASRTIGNMAAGLPIQAAFGAAIPGTIRDCVRDKLDQAINSGSNGKVLDTSA